MSDITIQREMLDEMKKKNLTLDYIETRLHQLFVLGVFTVATTFVYKFISTIIDAAKSVG